MDCEESALVKSFPMIIVEIGLGTAENEPSNVFRTGTLKSLTRNTRRSLTGKHVSGANPRGPHTLQRFQANLHDLRCGHGTVPRVQQATSTQRFSIFKLKIL